MKKMICMTQLVVLRVLNDDFVAGLTGFVPAHLLSFLLSLALLNAVLRLVQFLKIYILQGSVAMRFGCGGIFSDSFITNLPESRPVKDL